MVGYRRMGNMGQQHLGNVTTAASPLHHIRDMWKSPRGTVLRIEGLALVAISLSFFLAIFGSCRRWSNHFLIQKGFLAANALFLSLGTYSIGLMQSSRVKSEMYPIWAVSLLALLCCVDSTVASGFDNRNQLLKMLYQLCLYFGYVLLMSITTISSDIGNIAICVLAALTFIKGFHRSMALVLPSSMRNMIREIPASRNVNCCFGDLEEESEESGLIVDMKLDVMVVDRPVVVMGDIASMRCKEGNNRMVESDLDACKDVCLSFSLSHLLHRRFLGLRSIEQKTTQPLVKKFERAFKLVEIELAFLYDILYTSNTFLHYYEAKSATIWAFASVVGICFLGAVIPRARTTHRASPAGTIFVNNTTADFVITGVILVSLALLQMLQLLRSWTSNWARVAFACDYARNMKRRNRIVINNNEEEGVLNWGMRLRASLLKMSWFDDKYHLWQNKLGQHSVVDLETLKESNEEEELPRCCSFLLRLFCCCFYCICICFPCLPMCCISDNMKKFCSHLKSLVQRCLGVLGLQYISRELQEMLRGCGTEIPLQLHTDVKAYIGDFVGNKIRSPEVNDWASSSVENGQNGGFPDFPFTGGASNAAAAAEMNEVMYVSCILMWHIATCYCQLQLKMHHVVVDNNNKDHRVATALSKYCIYLVASAPRLLPGRSETAKSVWNKLVKTEAEADKSVCFFPSSPEEKVREMEEISQDHDKEKITLDAFIKDVGRCIYALGVNLGKGLQGKAPTDRWKILAEFWVKALVFAAPSDNVEEHMQRLSQGGELITHLWAMLYHAGIDKWQLQLPAQDNFKMGWDYIFRIRSWTDLEHHKGKNKQLVNAGHPSEVRTGVCHNVRLDGASSSCPSPPSP